ncbi:hypothetical protein BC834DRAFT_252178 [Gloeopeniophorella convolvens]|nr:hypothetical protein BC834DRAFT_252178 [Gloeopeniophorella convolvens]
MRPMRFDAVPCHATLLAGASFGNPMVPGNTQASELRPVANKIRVLLPLAHAAPQFSILKRTCIPVTTFLAVPTLGLVAFTLTTDISRADGTLTGRPSTTCDGNLLRWIVTVRCYSPFRKNSCLASTVRLVPTNVASGVHLLRIMRLARFVPRLRYLRNRGQ